ncbi:MAG: DNA replication terminus site-binding protein [Enterobacterales bacterium endosymbiont of Blomia tropicalis]|uniref:DNA replication terminus site-binding protein n=1 Tax=Mixta mediterraneensis TaxID=2758443 RepID=UPI001875FBC5|nr:DNA replication terminus site-binding protein [Mixta mediterraneensis]MBE5251572.1 DNA replication terminus site-binding protein [Mixta mediterraneensis]MDL4915070.1 DNA replication terminus site-binding protein [Mixta mediterraneensis]
MSRYDLVADLHQCINDLERALASLRQMTESQPLLIARVFSLPPVEKGREHDAITQIAVEQHLGETAREMALNHYCRLFMQHQSEKLSTKAAVRLPGAICIECDDARQQQITLQIDEINQLKAQLEKLITVDSGLPSEARFEFVHQHLRGLITLNAYRTITLLQAPDSLRFGWANKHIIKNVTREEIMAKLEKSLKAGRSQAPWSREQWAQKVQEELESVRALPASARLKIKRPVKVQPIARVWRADEKKQTQLACPSPILVLCRDRTQVPLLGELLNYDADNITYRHKPAAEPLYLLIPRLHLWVDSPV